MGSPRGLATSPTSGAECEFSASLERGRRQARARSEEHQTRLSQRVGQRGQYAHFQGRAEWWASLSPQRLTIPSAEREREARLQSSQCLEITAHTFMGWQIRSGLCSPASTVRTPNSIPFHLERKCLSPGILESRALASRSVLALDTGCLGCLRD